MTVTLNILLSGVPKRTILDMAFEDCGLAGFDFERTAEEITAALRKLNAMMKEWPWNVLPYNQPIYGVGQAEELSNIPGDAEAAVATALALRIAPALGLTLAPEQRAVMARSVATFMAQYSSVPDMQFAGRFPRGAGHRRSRIFTPSYPSYPSAPQILPPTLPPIIINNPITAAPVFITLPSISPNGGFLGQTFTAVDGFAANTLLPSTRRWLLNGSLIGIGPIVQPSQLGSLVLEVTAHGSEDVIGLSAAVSITTDTPSFMPALRFNDARNAVYAGAML